MARRLAFSLALGTIFFSATFHTLATSKGTLIINRNEDEAAKALAEYVANLSDKYIKEKKKFVVGVAGGSYLPDTMRKLVEEPYLHSVDWSAWHMFWVDEKLVSYCHSESNFGNAYYGRTDNDFVPYNGYVPKLPIPSCNIHAVNVSLPLEAAAADYEARIKVLVQNKIIDVSESSGFPKFDLMILGVGVDGHVAGLFTNHSLLQEKHKWVASTDWVPIAPPQRITFTLPLINSAKNIAFVITNNGFPKQVTNWLADMVQKGVKGGQGENLRPIEMVSPQGNLTWILDKATAAKL